MMALNFEQLTDSLIDKRWEFGSYNHPNEASQEDKQVVLLVDIAKSLRAIKKAVQCRNVLRAAVAVQVIERMLADDRKPKPRKPKKAGRAPKKQPKATGGA